MKECLLLSLILWNLKSCLMSNGNAIGLLAGAVSYKAFNIDELKERMNGLNGLTGELFNVVYEKD